MADLHRTFLHRGRLTQIPIYLGKQLRGLVYQNDWKVLPMSAIIAAVVSLVVKGDFFKTSEGTLKGAFALTCVAIWNGCFNSIQVICRERSIVKRDHRSGMHITSYVVSHMLYQALLCLAQTVVTMIVCVKCGVQFPTTPGLVIKPFLVELSLTVFLITYASDMISLFISSLVHTTTAAMTVMPFVLIFQLVFSGGFFNLPKWGTFVAKYTTSHYGLCCINAEANFNSLGSSVGWKQIVGMKNKLVRGTVKLGQITQVLGNKQNGFLKPLRNKQIKQEELMQVTASFLADGPIKTALTNAAATLSNDGITLTWGDVIDAFMDSETVKNSADIEVPYAFTIEQIMEIFGEDTVKQAISTQMAVAGRKADYEHTEENIVACWTQLIITSLVFALLAVIALEFIDKDKR